jgi:hypothetical protein
MSQVQVRRWHEYTNVIAIDKDVVDHPWYWTAGIYECATLTGL